MLKNKSYIFYIACYLPFILISVIINFSPNLDSYNLLNPFLFLETLFSDIRLFFFQGDRYIVLGLTNYITWFRYGDFTFFLFIILSIVIFSMIYYPFIYFTHFVFEKLFHIPEEKSKSYYFIKFFLFFIYITFFGFYKAVPISIPYFCSLDFKDYGFNMYFFGILTFEIYYVIYDIIMCLPNIAVKLMKGGKSELW